VNEPNPRRRGEDLVREGVYEEGIFWKFWYRTDYGRIENVRTSYVGRPNQGIPVYTGTYRTQYTTLHSTVKVPVLYLQYCISNDFAFGEPTSIIIITVVPVGVHDVDSLSRRRWDFNVQPLQPTIQYCRRSGLFVVRGPTRPTVHKIPVTYCNIIYCIPVISQPTAEQAVVVVLLREQQATGDSVPLVARAGLSVCTVYSLLLPVAVVVVTTAVVVTKENDDTTTS
jgi:hypothetical protein